MDFTSVVIFHIGNEPDRIDFLSKVQGLNFDEAFKNKETLHIKNYRIPILHFDDLIANKLLAGRLKDQADIENLMKIKRLKKN